MPTKEPSLRARSTRPSIFIGDLAVGTLVAAAIAGCVGQMALAILAVLKGLFQLDPGPGRIRGVIAPAQA